MELNAKERGGSEFTIWLTGNFDFYLENEKHINWSRLSFVNNFFFLFSVYIYFLCLYLAHAVSTSMQRSTNVIISTTARPMVIHSTPIAHPRITACPMIIAGTTAYPMVIHSTTIVHPQNHSIPKGYRRNRSKPKSSQ